MTTMYHNEPLRAIDKRYGGTAYIGVATGEFGVSEAHVSVFEMMRRPGDSLPVFRIATKGWEARQDHVEAMLASSHDWLLLLDGDMGIPPMLLERLRSHGLPCVSGHYLRRGFRPMKPIWFEDDPEFRWPMMPFRETPISGRLYRLGGTGSGCWLIHREVLEAVQPLLKDEPFFCDDAMTWWPYDIEAVAAGREKLRLLRGRRDRVGSDLRLAFFIRQAGYTIWGDPDAACGHFVQYPLSLTDWEMLPRKERDALAAGIDHDLSKIRDDQEADLRNLRALAGEYDRTATGYARMVTGGEVVVDEP